VLHFNQKFIIIILPNKDRTTSQRWKWKLSKHKLEQIRVIKYWNNCFYHQPLSNPAFSAVKSGSSAVKAAITSEKSLGLYHLIGQTR